MLVRAHQYCEIDHIDEANLNFRHVLLQQPGRRYRFERWHVANTGQDHIGIGALVIAGKTPAGSAARTMLDRLLHVQPLELLLLATSDQIHVVARAQAVVEGTEQRIGIGRVIDTRDGAAARKSVVDKARRLMTKTIMVVPPGMAGEKNVQRSNGPAPRQFLALLQ